MFNKAIIKDFNHFYLYICNKWTGKTNMIFREMTHIRQIDRISKNIEKHGIIITKLQNQSIHLQDFINF